MGASRERLLCGAKLDRVAVGIEDPELASSGIRRRFEKFDSAAVQISLGGLEIFDLNREMRTQRIDLAHALVAGDQVDLVFTDAVPGAAELEIGTRQFFEV